MGNYKKRQVSHKVSNRDLKEINELRLELGLTKVEPKSRTCLSCNKSFKSISSGNRTCDYCKGLFLKRNEYAE